jgi:hypothetical protein
MASPVPEPRNATTSQAGPDSNLQPSNAERLRGISVGDARDWASRCDAAVHAQEYCAISDFNSFLTLVPGPMDRVDNPRARMVNGMI